MYKSLAKIYMRILHRHNSKRKNDKNTSYMCQIKNSCHVIPVKTQDERRHATFISGGRRNLVRRICHNFFTLLQHICGWGAVPATHHTVCQWKLLFVMYTHPFPHWVTAIVGASSDHTCGARPLCPWSHTGRRQSKVNSMTHFRKWVATAEHRREYCISQVIMAPEELLLHMLPRTKTCNQRRPRGR